MPCNPPLLPPLVGSAALCSRCAAALNYSLCLHGPCHHQTLQPNPFRNLPVPLFSPSFALPLCTVRPLCRQLYWLLHDAAVQTFCSTVIEQPDVTLKLARVRWCLHSQAAPFAAHGNRVHSAVDCARCSTVGGCACVATEHAGPVNQTLIMCRGPQSYMHRRPCVPRLPVGPLLDPQIFSGETQTDGIAPLPRR